MPGGPVGIPVGGQGLPPHWEDPSYFSEPEFDSEFQHQHIHKSKVSFYQKNILYLFSLYKSILSLYCHTNSS